MSGYLLLKVTCLTLKLILCAQLEREIFSVLRSQIRSWRGRFPTVIRDFMLPLQPLLQHLEKLKQMGNAETLRPGDLGADHLAVRRQQFE